MRGQKRLHVLILMRICTHLGRLAGPIADRDPALALLQGGQVASHATLATATGMEARNHPANGHGIKSSREGTHGRGESPA